MKRWSLLAVLVLGVGGVAWMTMTRARAASEARSAEAASAASSGAELVAPALVEGAGEVLELGFESTGRVSEVLVREGERVQRGQVLARLDDRLARARVASAEGALAVVRARRDAALRGSRAGEVRAAEADVAALEAEARKEQALRVRNERLLAGGALTADEMDRARGAAESATAQAEAAAARLALVREGTRTEHRREAAAAVVVAEADLAAARVLLDQTALRAPSDGVILRRKVEPGEQVVLMPPTVVVTLCDLERLRLRAEIDEADVGRVRVGQRGYASAEAYGPRRFPGRVVEIMRELGRKNVRTDDPRARVDTRVLEVVLELEGNPALPLGLRLDVHLQ